MLEKYQFIQGGVSEDKLEEILSTFKNDVLSGIRLAGVAVGDTTSSNTCLLVEHNHSPIKKTFIWENDYVPPFKQKRNGLKERNLPWGYNWFQ